MSLQFVARKNEEIHFSDILPEYLHQFAINGATCKVATGTFGYLLFQQIKTPNFSIRYRDYFLTEANQLLMTYDKPMLELLFNLNAPLHYQLDGLGNLDFNKDTYNIVYVPFVNGILPFEIKQTYKTFSISYQVDYLASLAVAFPAIHELMKKVLQKEPTVLCTNSFNASREVITIIHDILKCHYTGELLQVYLNAKITNILFLCLENNQHNL